MKKAILFLACTVTFIFVLMLAVSAAPTFAPVGEPIPGMGEMHIFGDEDNGTPGHCDGWYESKYENTANNDAFARVELTYVDANGKEVSITYPTYYILKNDSTLTWDFERVSAHLGVTIGVDNISKIEIPYGTTVIPERAFVDPSRWDPTISAEHPKGHVSEPHPNLTYVYLENTVQKIEDLAFAHCESLTEVGSETLGDHEGEDGPAMGNHNHQMLQYIGYRAFHYCSLTDFNFNKHLVYIGEGAFRGNNFKVINLSKCVELKVVPAHCFHEAEGTISTIVMSVSVEEIGDNAFTGSAASTVFLGLNLKKIGHEALVMNDLDCLIIPVSLETVYSDSFSFGNKSYQPIFVPAKYLADAERVINTLKVAGYTELKQINNVGKLFSDSVEYWKTATLCTDWLGGHIADPYSGIERLEYPYGINHEGTAYGGACAVCGQSTPKGKFEVRPILISKGYSICTYNGLYAFANGFEIYHNALHVYEQVYGEVELGILFLRNSAYIAGADLRNDISSMGICLDQKTLMGDQIDSYSSMDFIFTYSKGIGAVNGSTTNRGAEELVIAAYLLHSNQNAKHPVYDEDGNRTEEVEILYNTSYYVQDSDDLCVDGKTSDGKYVTVSYYSIYGEIQRQGGI